VKVELIEAAGGEVLPDGAGAPGDRHVLFAGGAAASSLRAVIRLALEFRTWQVLATQGLPDQENAKLLRRAVAGVGTRDPGKRSTVSH
jgi:hypothetical protein